MILYLQYVSIFQMKFLFITFIYLSIYLSIYLFIYLFILHPNISSLPRSTSLQSHPQFHPPFLLCEWGAFLWVLAHQVTEGRGTSSPTEARQYGSLGNGSTGRPSKDSGTTPAPVVGDPREDHEDKLFKILVFMCFWCCVATLVSFFRMGLVFYHSEGYIIIATAAKVASQKCAVKMTSYFEWHTCFYRLKIE